MYDYTIWLSPSILIKLIIYKYFKNDLSCKNKLLSKKITFDQILALLQLSFFFKKKRLQVLRVFSRERVPEKNGGFNWIRFYI